MVAVQLYTGCTAATGRMNRNDGCCCRTLAGKDMDKRKDVIEAFSDAESSMSGAHLLALDA